MPTKKEWQVKHGLTDSEMTYLEAILKAFDGSIVAIVDNPERKIL